MASLAPYVKAIHFMPHINEIVFRAAEAHLIQRTSSLEKFCDKAELFGSQIILPSPLMVFWREEVCLSFYQNATLTSVVFSIHGLALCRRGTPA